MKNIISALLCVAALAASVTVSFGQLSLPSIGSPDILRQGALSSVVRGYRGVYSRSMIWDAPGTVVSAEVTGKSGAEQVLHELFDTEFSYELANTNDVVNGYVYLYDANDNLLFFGYAEYTLADLQWAGPVYSIWLQSVPVLSGVESAEVLAMDGNGKTGRRYQLEVNKLGQLKLPPWMAGTLNGLMVVKMQDGTTRVYRMSGAQMEVVSTSEIAGYNIQGHHEYSPAPGSGQNINIMELWDRPTVLLTISDPVDTIVNFDVTGVVRFVDGGLIQFERPTAMVVTVTGGVTFELPMEPVGTNSYAFSNGEYRIYFKWDKFGQPGYLYAGDDGKGSPPLSN